VHVSHVDSSTLAFSLSSHRLIHKFCLYLSLSRFIINSLYRPKKVYVRHVDSSTLSLAFSLSSHRLIHKFCLYLSLSRFIINKLLWKYGTTSSCNPSPRTLILDFSMTHIRFVRSNLHPIGQLTHTRSSDGVPDPDGDLNYVKDSDQG
jgi:hypothetical protein